MYAWKAHVCTYVYGHMGAHVHIVTYTLHMPTTKHMHIHMPTNSHTCSGLIAAVMISRTRESSCCLFSPNTCSYNKENRKGLGAKDRKGKWPVHRSRHWAVSLGGMAPGKEAEAPCGIWAAPSREDMKVGPRLVQSSQGPCRAGDCLGLCAARLLPALTLQAAFQGQK